MLKIGWKASAEQFGPRELVEFAVLAEELGYDSAVVSDHFHPWRHDGGHAPFSFAVLGAMGARTSRIALGTSVVAPAYRYHPAIVAQAMATLGVLYPKRVLLGVGTGEALNEIPLGVEWPDQKVRFQMLKEACILIAAAVARGPRDLRGRVLPNRPGHDLRQAREPIPLYIAAAGPAAARLAGRIADGFITTSGKDPALYAEKLVPAVREGIEKEGRSPGEVELMLEVKVSFDEDASRALEDTQHWGALALTPEEKVDVDDPIEMERLADALPVERTASRWIASNDPDHHVSALREYVELGFTHLVCHFPGPDQERALRGYSEHVVPRLRALAP